MKTLLPNQAIELLPAEDEVLARGCKVMQRVTPDYYHPDWLNYGVKEGWFEAAQVQDNGTPIYVVWFHKSPDGGLIVNAAASLINEDRIEALATALVKLAQQKKCRYVEFHTARRGLVVKARRFGYNVESVILRRNLQ